MRPAFAVLLFAALSTHACGGGSPALGCLSNMRGQAIGQLVYAGDHDERLTPRGAWMDDAALSAARAPKRPETVPMLDDSVNPIRNASDLVTSLPKPGRHEGRDGIAYADGHAKMVRVP